MVIARRFGGHDHHEYFGVYFYRRPTRMAILFIICATIGRDIYAGTGLNPGLFGGGLALLIDSFHLVG